MIPCDVLQMICTYCDLPTRYCMSQTSRQFAWDETEWERYCQYYSVAPASRDVLKQLILHGFLHAWGVRQCLSQVWCTHTNKPLRVWTPKINHQFNSKSNFFFITHFRFVDFVRYVGHALELRMLHVFRRHRNSKAVVVPIWTLQRIQFYQICHDTKRRLRSMKRLCRRQTWKLRALVEFDIHMGILRPRVRQIEIYT